MMQAIKFPDTLFYRCNKPIHEYKLARGHIVCDDNNNVLKLLIVESGCLRVYKRSKDGRTYTLYRVQSGECCSLSIACIINNLKFPAVIEAESEEVVVHEISANLVKQLIQESKPWQNFIFAQFSQKFTQIINLTNNMVFNNMESRIAHLLQRRQDHYKCISSTHQCIANEVGTSREVVSRSLRLLESKGCVKLTRGKVEIIDEKALNQLIL